MNSQSLTQSITEPSRKTRVLPGGQIPPLTQLKLRSYEDRDWALHLGDFVCALEAIEEIKNKLAIDLKWQSSYTRFCQWQAQQERLEDLQDSLQDLEEIRLQGDPAATIQSVRTLAMAVLLNEAYKDKRVDLFAALNRQLLAEQRLALEERKLNLREKAIADHVAHNAQKLELAQRAQQEDNAIALKKVQLVEQKLQLEVRKYDDAQKESRKPENQPLTEDEKCRRICAVFGMEYDEEKKQRVATMVRLDRERELAAQTEGTATVPVAPVGVSPTGFPSEQLTPPDNALSTTPANP